MPLDTSAVLNNRYRIVKLVGQGGFGAVYRAWDLNLSKACAVKENLDTSAEAQKQFTREAGILANLNHPGLPRVTDYFIIPGQGQYLVMDFIEGDDLQTLLNRTGGKLPEEQVLSIMEQISDALSYLHNQKPPLIHRDIKPLNIIITPEGRAVLVDFGIVKIYDSKTSTTLGARAYTPGYSPPEQYGQGGTDALSDLYALAATMYTLLTGQIPVESVQRSTGQELPSIRSLNPGISDDTEIIVRKAMQLVPSQRYQSVAAFSAALESQGPVSTIAVQNQGLAGSYVGAPPVSKAASSSSRSVPKWIWWAGGAALVIIIGILAVVFGIGGGGEEEDPSGTDSAIALAQTEVYLTDQFIATSDSIEETTIPPTEIPTDIPTSTIPPTPSPSSEPTETPPPAVVPLSGDRLTQLTFDPADYYNPMLSRDQRRLITFASVNDHWQIVEIDPNGGGVVKDITFSPNDHHHPRFSSDGEKIIMAADFDGYFNIYIIDSHSGAILQQLTESQSSNMTPFWFPDETSFVFMSNRDGDYEIYQGFMDGSPHIQLTSNNSYDGSSSVSPDGRYVVFYSNRDGNPEIYLLDLETDQETRLTDSPARDAEPAFSPDGEWIVFESNRNGSYDIWAMRLDGSGLKQMTGSPDNEQVPSVSPDGLWLLFQSNQNGSYDIFRVPWN